jgi:SAM-dependent methyltransferase
MFRVIIALRTGLLLRLLEAASASYIYLRKCDRAPCDLPRVDRVNDASPPKPETSGEYTVRGEYHRQPSRDWDYYPTYQLKLSFVRRYLGALSGSMRVLDAGCGEGVLVEEFHDRLRIVGLDENYSSEHVRRGSLMALPYPNRSFDRVLCLDVLEHLAYADQPRALAELRRVVTDDGEVLLSLPNLAHLQSRLNFLVAGRLIRTASEVKHPGDRPISEYLRLADRAGFDLISRAGINPTFPVVTHWIRQEPRSRAWVHDLLTRLLPWPGLCFLNLVRLRPRRAA